MVAVNKDIVKSWARFACSSGETDSNRWKKQVKEMTKEDMSGLLAYLAGYFGHSNDSRLDLEKLAC